MLQTFENIVYESRDIGIRGYSALYPLSRNNRFIKLVGQVSLIDVLIQ